MFASLCSAEPRTKVCLETTNAVNIVLLGINRVLLCFDRGRWFATIVCLAVCGDIVASGGADKVRALAN